MNIPLAYSLSEARQHFLRSSTTKVKCIKGASEKVCNSYPEAVRFFNPNEASSAASEPASGSNQQLDSSIQVETIRHTIQEDATPHNHCHTPSPSHTPSDDRCSSSSDSSSSYSGSGGDTGGGGASGDW